MDKAAFRAAFPARSPVKFLLMTLIATSPDPATGRVPSPSERLREVVDNAVLAEQLQVARRLLIDTLDQVGDEAVAERLAQRLRAGQRPEPVRPVALATATRTLQGTSRLRRRRQVAARLDHRPDGTIRVVGRGIDTTLGPEYAWILAGIPQEGDFSPDDLQTRRSPTADPGAGEPSVDAVTGCAHLLRAGLLVPAQDGGTGPTSQAASRA